MRNCKQCAKHNVMNAGMCKPRDASVAEGGMS